MILWCKTRHTPDGFRFIKENWKRSITIRIAVMIILLIPVSIWGSDGLSEPNNPWTYYFITVYTSGMAVIFAVLCEKDWADKVYRAIAARDHNVYTTMAQIVILARLRPNVAQDIMDGKYDEFSLDHDCLKYFE